MDVDVFVSPDVGDLNFDHTDTIEVDFPNPVRRRTVSPTRAPHAISCGLLLPPSRACAHGGQFSTQSRGADCGGLDRMI